jgi:phage baseplate assembly protein W
MSLYKDIDLSFDLDAKGDIKMVSDIDAINQGLRILVETITGSRPGPNNELFGLNLRRYLFSNMTYPIAEQIGQSIQDQVVKFEPRVDLKDVSVEIDEDNRAYNIELLYIIRNSGKGGSFRMIVSLK